MDTNLPSARANTSSKICESKYERLRKIGIGSYGVVFKCVNRQSGRVVAIKRYSENDSDPVIRKIAMREVRMLRQLKHPNLINLIEVFRRKRRLHLVFDYCELTVLDVIEKYGNNCPLNLIKKISWQTVNAIKYCHEHNCIHRDIKPENILINQSGIVKLCDFGFARTFAKTAPASLAIAARREAPETSRRPSERSGASDGPQERQAFTDYVATRWYRAPELLIGEIYYDFKIDIWAIGCVTAELMRGEPMWPGMTDLDQLSIISGSLGQLTGKQTQTLLDRAIYEQASIERLINQSAAKPTSANPETLERKLPGRVGQAGLDFVQACLQMDPDLRPTSGDLLLHSFIRSHKMGQFVEAAERQRAQQARKIERLSPAESSSNSDLVKQLLGSRSSVLAGRSRAAKASENHERPLTLPELAEAREQLAMQAPARYKQKRKYDQQLESASKLRNPKSLVPVSTARRSSQADSEPARRASRLALMPLSVALNQQLAQPAGQPKRKPSTNMSSAEPPSQRTKIASRPARQANAARLAHNTPSSLQQSNKLIRAAMQSGSGAPANQLASWRPVESCSNGMSYDGKIYADQGGLSKPGKALDASPFERTKRANAKLEALPSISMPSRRQQAASTGKTVASYVRR